MHLKLNLRKMFAGNLTNYCLMYNVLITLSLLSEGCTVELVLNVIREI